MGFSNLALPLRYFSEDHQVTSMPICVYITISKSKPHTNDSPFPLAIGKKPRMGLVSLLWHFGGQTTGLLTKTCVKFIDILMAGASVQLGGYLPCP